jgi:ribose 5-phosphate isomerase A
VVVRLGTGSTVSPAVRELGKLIAGGELEGVRGVTTSGRMEALARRAGVPLVALSEARDHHRRADEIGPGLPSSRDAGSASEGEDRSPRFRELPLFVADESKLVESLGQGHLPVGIEPFG